MSKTKQAEEKIMTYEKATEHLHYAVNDAEYNVKRTAQKLVEQADWIIRRLQGAKDRMNMMLDNADKEPLVLREHTGLNSLGELQAAGVEFDRLCGELYKEQDHLKTMGALLGKFQSII